MSEKEPKPPKRNKERCEDVSGDVSEVSEKGLGGESTNPKVLAILNLSLVEIEYVDAHDADTRTAQAIKVFLNGC